MEPLFKIPRRTNPAGDKKLISKMKNSTTSKVVLKKGVNLLDKINNVVAVVNKTLGPYKDNYSLINSEEDLKDYISEIEENRLYSLDTETTGLDPLLDNLVGISICTANKKPAYIPLNHKSYITMEKANNQLDVEFVKEQFQRISEIPGIMFNGVFDLRVMKNQLGVNLYCWWDCFVAAKLLNENLLENGLKYLYQKFCATDEDIKSFTDYFKGISFDLVPISTGYLYAAKDAEMTYELFNFQRKYLLEVPEDRADLLGVATVFRLIEMPLVPVIVEMEDNGIAFDFEYQKELSEKYHKQLEKIEQNFYDQLEEFSEKIEVYKRENLKHKLSEPININSPTQISILLYDILGYKSVSKKSPRGTGEEILVKFDTALCKTILEYRGVAKLISTYIDKMPNMVNPNTNKIHCEFNQYGAVTGRFSSSEPNMQNIPAKNKDIRKMFIADEGMVLISCDYSQQEPRITAHMSKDKSMIKAYRDGKDLYATIAALAFEVDYDDCKEFYPDGKTNREGKKRRDTAKKVVLSVCYGKQVPSLAKDLGVSIKKAQEIYDKIMDELKGLKQFMQDSQNMARELGYVTTVWGRKRRLPKMQLKRYEFSYLSTPKNYDPLNFENTEIPDVPVDIIEKYVRILNNCRNGWERRKIINSAKEKDNILIIDNNGYIEEATRQCVNSRIQGSAADLTKKAMILVGTDDILKNLGFKLLLTVHDELIGECSEEVAKEVSERFSYLMIKAAEDLIVPSKCDVEITKCWYGKEIEMEEDYGN